MPKACAAAQNRLRDESGSALANKKDISDGSTKAPYARIPFV